ncbi:hypothetical protein EJ05DRAFT_446134 [Pseudovirgaria hyperparasitica]|uniref:Nucleolar protein 12 n=1 Tax=Pseudovirgaria hyperparasitica TaxID=470096 RepID=A0A6A6VUA6_9PEZI|nr:uncharacterized protein EJ05DRAFT_446134 [Pseudovirgaria hyperparasitica]KAF2752827.1 hypothetical protein EJ05DRAFT_446134 [Pseudovirgaria hyperparasitica]
MGPVPKRHKKLHFRSVDEVSFDFAAREDYLTGFHKRKQARIKHAQELAIEKERLEKIAERAKLRKQRKEDLEKHVDEVNTALRKVNGDPSDEYESGDSQNEDRDWNGFGDDVPMSREDEYIDEDKYITVQVEAVNITRDGMFNVDIEPGDQHDDRISTTAKHEVGEDLKKRVWTKDKPTKEKAKKAKPKFRYESKAERKITRHKERSKSRSQAKARRS